jgi:hypothetical protein
MKLYTLKPLIKDMRKNNIDKEHYTFNYNDFKFDVIISLNMKNIEILVGIHSVNWACVFYSDFALEVNMSDEDFFSLLNILNLKAGKNSFTSFKFLYLLSTSAPKKSSKTKVSAVQLRPFIKVRKVDEANKIFFKGWHPHLTDGKHAKNFDKTEFFFGKKVANYCRANNISSIWTDIPSDEVAYYPPQHLNK